MKTRMMCLLLASLVLVTAVSTAFADPSKIVPDPIQVETQTIEIIRGEPDNPIAQNGLVTLNALPQDWDGGFESKFREEVMAFYKPTLGDPWASATLGKVLGAFFKTAKQSAAVFNPGENTRLVVVGVTEAKALGFIFKQQNGKNYYAVLKAVTIRAKSWKDLSIEGVTMKMVEPGGFIYAVEN